MRSILKLFSNRQPASLAGDFDNRYASAHTMTHRMPRISSNETERNLIFETENLSISGHLC